MNGPTGVIFYIVTTKSALRVRIVRFHSVYAYDKNK